MTKIDPRIWRHTILTGEDEETLRNLRDEASTARKQHGADSDEYRAAASSADEFAAEAKARGTEVILRTIASRKKMRAIRDAHPPREDNETDKALGFNADTYPEALAAACLASPALNDEAREEFLDSLTEGDGELVSTAAYTLHRLPSADPKGLLLSGPTAT